MKKIADEKKRAVLQSFQSNPEKPFEEVSKESGISRVTILHWYQRYLIGDGSWAVLGKQGFCHYMEHRDIEKMSDREIKVENVFLRAYIEELLKEVPDSKKKSLTAAIGERSTNKSFKTSTREILKCTKYPSSAYYYRCKHQGDKKEKDKPLVSFIKVIQQENNRLCGSRVMIVYLYRKTGIRYGRRRVSRIRRENGLQATIRRRKHKAHGYFTQKEAQQLKTLPNILNREFKAEKPLQKLITDATYLPIKGGWCYFSPVIDLFDRSVRAYEIGKTLRIEGNLSLLDQLNKLHLEQDVLLHSDQGVSYTSLAYRERLLNSNIQQSMSRRGNCWDNAVIESFFGYMKDELGVRRKTNRSLLDFKQMKEIMEQWILYYNQDRPHSTLGWKSPLEYRQEALYATNIVTPTK